MHREMSDTCPKEPATHSLIMKFKYLRAYLSLYYSFLLHVNYSFLHSCFSNKLIQYAFDFQDFLSKDCYSYLSVSTIFFFLYSFYFSVIWVGWGQVKCLLDVILWAYYFIKKILSNYLCELWLNQGSNINISKYLDAWSFTNE